VLVCVKKTYINHVFVLIAHCFVNVKMVTVTENQFSNFVCIFLCHNISYTNYITVKFKIPIFWSLHGLCMNMSLLLYHSKYRTLRKNWGGKGVIFESSL
jgi:hypothetical protein